MATRLACAFVAAALLCAVASAYTPTEKTIRATTFNGGLASIIPYLTEREGPIFTALTAESKETDVLCLQEFWTDKYIRSAGAAVKAELPHFAGALDPFTSKAGEPMTGSACSLGVAFGFASCLPKCQTFVDIVSAPGGNTTANATLALDCFVKNCAEQTKALVAEVSCFQCILATIAGDGEKELTDCASVVSANKRYDNRLGVAIFSRFPIKKQEVFVLPTITGSRAAVYAEIAPVEGGETIGFTCTHLIDDDRSRPYAGFYKSFTGEQMAQMHAMAAAIFSKTDKLAPTGHVLIGDLNSGPALTGTYGSSTPFTLTAETPGNYADLLKGEFFTEEDTLPKITLAGGFSNKLAAMAAANTMTKFPCTWCPTATGAANTVAYGNNSLIDHVLLYGDIKGTETDAKIVLDNREAITLGSGSKIPVSDHYGVRTTFKTTIKAERKDTPPPENGASSQHAAAGALFSFVAAAASVLVARELP